MEYVSNYISPLGKMLLAAEDKGLTGAWFEGQKYFARGLSSEYEERELSLFKDVKYWLDLYFSGQEPKFQVPIHLIGTSFQQEVWEILCEIPYGETMTYGSIAAKIARKRGVAGMSAQAVGGAVGHNPISVIVPCHRVLGAGGRLTGYAGGVERKRKLLELERALSEAVQSDRSE